MKTKILFFLLFPIFVFAQNQKIQLIDQETKEPLQFVELLYNNENMFSDKNGNIFIDFNDNKLQVLDGNYKPNLVEITANTKVIELQNQTTQLEEMIISKKPRTIINPQKKNLSKFFFINSEISILSEFFFKPEYQNKYLKKISFKISPELYFKTELITKNDIKKFKNSTQLLRIIVLDKNKNEIFTSNAFEFLPKKKSPFSVDIYEDILITNEPIFVEIQALGSLDVSGTFLNKNIAVSIRPEQVKIKSEEFNVNVWYKKRNVEMDFRDLNKINLYESFINFGFEFEDVD